VQKCLEFFWQVWIGEIGKKDYHNPKRVKKIVNHGIYEDFWILNIYIFWKIFQDFPKFFDKISNP